MALTKKERRAIEDHWTGKTNRSAACRKLGYLRKNGEPNLNRFYRAFYEHMTDVNEF